ncbi:MAG TPA: circadian clock protein KaiC [Bryobacteraceae bacterium]|nr:circadian clock protein KaiC [Bryobacteraceae bacterium]
MARRNRKVGAKTRPLAKARTGITGFDEITFGGLPQGRPTLVCGSAGCGKTLFGLEFLVRGILEFGEPGVCMTFEERAADLAQNVAALGFDLQSLIDGQKLIIDHVNLERSMIEETGEYDLEGLFVRLNHAIDSIGAKRVLLDTIEALFAGLSNESILRAELRRLFLWLKEKGVTAVITGERGEGTLTRHGLEEYVSDCVIVLDHRITNSVSTRRLRVVKYRGSTHGCNEYPFLIDHSGFSVLPLTSIELNHQTSQERVSTGIPRMDEMLGGQGFYRGTSILISGTAGVGKSSISSSIADAACRRGERCLVFAFEESQAQVVRNMRSIDIDLEPWIKKGLLRYEAARPTMFGLEMHLVRMHKAIQMFQPSVVVVDPLSSMLQAGDDEEARNTMLRIVDHLKQRQITGVFTHLISDASQLEHTDMSISSLVDTWILLRDIEVAGERNRAIYVLKSRGMAHSNQIREFVITSRGIELRDAYLGPSGVLTGSARLALEAREKEAAIQRMHESARRKLEYERKIKALEAQIGVLQVDLRAEQHGLRELALQEEERGRMVEQERLEMAASRRSALSQTARTKKTARKAP